MTNKPRNICRLCGNPSYGKTCRDCFNKKGRGSVSKWRNRSKSKNIETKVIKK